MRPWSEALRRQLAAEKERVAEESGAVAATEAGSSFTTSTRQTDQPGVKMGLTGGQPGFNLGTS